MKKIELRFENQFKNEIEYTFGLDFRLNVKMKFTLDIILLNNLLLLKNL